MSVTPLLVVVAVSGVEEEVEESGVLDDVVSDAAGADVPALEELEDVEPHTPRSLVIAPFLICKQ